MRALTVLAAVLWLVCSGCRQSPPEEPSTVSVALPLPNEAERIQAALNDYLASKSIQDQPSYREALTDLNGDGRADLLMLLEGPGWCRDDGCTLLVFRDESDGYKLVGQADATWPPIILSPYRNHGWSDLLVDVGSHGETGTVALAYDGSRYPEDPTFAAQISADRLPAGQVLIAAQP